MDKVRWIVHPKLRPFYFQIKTYYLSDPNYPMDNPFQTDNPSLVWLIIIIIIIIITRIFIQDNLSVLIKRTVIKRVL